MVDAEDKPDVGRYDQEVHAVKASAILSFLLAFLAYPTVWAADPVVIVEPVDGAVVPPNFTVRVTYGEIEFCEADHCMDSNPNAANVVAKTETKDPEAVGECAPCPIGGTEFDVKLAPGHYQLIASVSSWSTSISSEPIMITVDDTASEDNDSSDNDSSNKNSSDGCACEADASSYGQLVWLGVAWLARPRRRRMTNC